MLFTRKTRNEEDNFASLYYISICRRGALWSEERASWFCTVTIHGKFCEAVSFRELWIVKK